VCECDCVGEWERLRERLIGRERERVDCARFAHDGIVIIVVHFDYSSIDFVYFAYCNDDT